MQDNYLLSLYQNYPIFGGFLMTATGIMVIGKPLFEAAAQTFCGALASYTFGKLKSRFYTGNTFDGAFDIWQRGIHHKTIQIDDRIKFDGLISPYVQLFPRDPYGNAKRWNSIYGEECKLSVKSPSEFSTLEFYAGSDQAIRTGSLNGETLVGLYNRYGYIGEGILGVVSTSELKKSIPDFFNEYFWGCRAEVLGVLSYSPAQHGHVAQSLFHKLGIPIDVDNYKEIPYIKINSIKMYKKDNDKIASLLGSPWAAKTQEEVEPFLVQYGYFSNPDERIICNHRILASKTWDKVQVFYDTLTAPTPSISFANRFLK